MSKKKDKDILEMELAIARINAIEQAFKSTAKILGLLGLTGLGVTAYTSTITDDRPETATVAPSIPEIPIDETFVDEILLDETLDSYISKRHISEVLQEYPAMDMSLALSPEETELLKKIIQTYNIDAASLETDGEDLIMRFPPRESEYKSQYSRDAY